MERKRKVDFNNDSQADQVTKRLKNFTDETATTRLNSGKYTLANNETRDHSKTVDLDDLDEIEQEQISNGFDDEAKMISLDVNEEMEEGHCDDAETFQLKKKENDEAHRAWLNEIDSTNVRNYKLKTPQAIEENLNDTPLTTNRLQVVEEEEDDDEGSNHQFGEINTLKSLLAIMQPTETVVHTIKRLGAAATSNKSKQRIKQRKPLCNEMSTLLSIESTPEKFKKNKFLLEEMTGLADRFVSNGRLDIYQETYEQLQTKLNHLQSTVSNSTDISTFPMSSANASVLSTTDGI